jgi:hypothetical protein
MARQSAPLSLDGSSISSDYEESITSARTFDSLDELLSRFTLDFRPEYALKIRNRSVFLAIVSSYFLTYFIICQHAPSVG